MQDQEGGEVPQANGGDESSKAAHVLSASEENEQRIKGQKVNRDRIVEEEIRVARGAIVPNLPEGEGDAGGSRLSTHRRKASDTWMQAQITAREKDVQDAIAQKRRSVYEDVKSMRLAGTAVVYEMEGGGGGGVEDIGAPAEPTTDARRATTLLDESLRGGGTVRSLAARFKGGTGRIETHATAHHRVASQEMTDRKARNNAKEMLVQPQFHGEGLYTDFLKRYRNGGTAQDKAQFLRAWVQHCREKGQEISLEDGQKFLRELGINRTPSARLQPLKPGTTTLDTTQQADMWTDWMLALQDAFGDADDRPAKMSTNGHLLPVSPINGSGRRADEQSAVKLPPGAQPTGIITAKVQQLGSYKAGHKEREAGDEEGAHSAAKATEHEKAADGQPAATKGVIRSGSRSESRAGGSKEPTSVDASGASSAKAAGRDGRTPRLQLDDSEHAGEDEDEDEDEGEGDQPGGKEGVTGQLPAKASSQRTATGTTSEEKATRTAVEPEGKQSPNDAEWQVLEEEDGREEEEEDEDEDEEARERRIKHIVLLDDILRRQGAPARQLSASTGNFPSAPPPSVKTRAEADEEEKWDTSISAMDDSLRAGKAGPDEVDKDEKLSKAEKRRAKKAERSGLCSWLCLPCCGNGGGVDSP